MTRKDARKALRALVLSACPQVGPRVIFGNAPQGLTLPFVATFELDAATADTHDAQSSTLVDDTFQLSCVDRDATGATAVRDAILSLNLHADANFQLIRCRSSLTYFDDKNDRMIAVIDVTASYVLD